MIEDNASEANNHDATAGPRHVAIIMDGNGRWAKQRGLPRTAGHRQGVEAVKRAVYAARDLGIEYLTLYSFSSENWNRPPEEVTELFSLLRYFIRRDLAELHKNNVRIHIIGQREGVPDDVLNLLDEAKTLTEKNDAHNLVIAFNYGGRQEILNAVKGLAKDTRDGKIDPDEICEDDISKALDTAGIPDPDLMIRTSGELRISNFLLWQLAYSEFVFLDCLWPDFSKEDFRSAISEFQSRDRRFGGLVRETG